jgi:hypothetical protein
MNGGTVVVKANEEGLVLDYFSKENYQAVGHLAQTSHSDFSSTYIGQMLQPILPDKIWKYLMTKK